MIFRRARLRLAALIGLAQVVTFGGFALAVYLFVVATFDFDRASGEATSTAETGFATLRIGLAGAVALVTVLSPVTSYAIAGLALAPARRAYEARQRFVDDASHELRTPLTALHAGLQLAVSRPRTPDEHVLIAERALAASNRIRSTVSDLLWLSRDERTGLPRTVVSLRRIVDEVVADLPVESATRVVIDEDRGGGEVEVPMDLARRAVANVVGNALRYSSGTVTVVTAAAPRMGLIRIADRGDGMSPAELARASEPFWRAHPGGEGGGLGLAIVERSMRAVGGSVAIDSVVGEGTRVTLSFPRPR